ncbi:MAG: hypothetical protein ACPGVO_18340 [Spirulinaceae cyanobacterium]
MAHGTLVIVISDSEVSASEFKLPSQSTTAKPTTSETPARFVVQPPMPQPEPQSSLSPEPESSIAEADASMPLAENGTEPKPAAGNDVEANGQPSNGNSSKLQQIVHEFADDFGEVIQFRAQE